MDFDRLCMMFTMQEPFYGILLSSMNRIETKRIPTLSVSKNGNVFQLNYNPDFLGKFNVDTILELAKHEVLHVAFNHFSIWDNPASSQEEQRLRNIAADLEINGYLDRSKIQKEAGGVFPEDYGFDRFEGTREYYRKLVKMMEDNRQEEQQQTQSGSPDTPCNDGQSDNTPSESQENNDSQTPDSTPEQQQSTPSNSDSQADKEFFDKFHEFDDHSEWPETEPDSSEAEQMQQMIDSLLDFAAEEVEKNSGSIPGEMKGRINKIRKKPRPVTDWKRYFRRYLGNEFTELIRKSKKRESRRFPDAAGNRHRRKSNILVAIDTSGSVSMPEYREFFGQIKTLQQQATFHVVECDTIIQHEYDFNGKQNEILHGGGGTDFQPPVDLFINNRRKYDALVYFTDGYAPIPKNTPKETLWVISSEGDKDRKKYKVNGASVVFIPNKQ